MLNKNSEGDLIIFSAPSGAGKSTIIKKIIDLSDGAIELSISATTRKPRHGEKEGIDYFFISNQEFDSLKESNAFLENAIVHGEQYGTLKSFVEEKTKKGSHLILDIDVQGFEQIKNKIKSIKSIFIIPPSFNELKERLLARDLDTVESIERRLLNAKKELEYAQHFSYLVLNEDFDEAVEQIFNIILNDEYKFTDDRISNLLNELLD